MRARLPRILVVAQVLLLAGQALGEDPSPAPEGFAWKRVESAKAWFLIPAGWYFKEESKSGTRAFFITQEDIDKSGEFQTGLTVNVLPPEKDPAPERAKNAIGALIQIGRLQDFWETEKGVLKGFGCRVRKVDEGQPPLVMHTLVIGNSRTNTLYILIFESLEKSWDEAWAKGETILKLFILDDEI